MKRACSVFVSQLSASVSRLRRAPRGACAFTLIELMMVVALIALLVGAFGLSLGDTGGNSLASAQKALGSLVGAARAQSAVNQTEARLVVYATRPPSGDSDKYLRLLQVFRNDPFGSTTWVAVGSPTYLPRGVYLVPTSTTGLLASGVTWPANPAPLSSLNSGFSLNAASAPVGTAFNGATLFWLGFNPDGSISGTVSVTPYAKLVLATGALSATNLPAFNNAGAVRGVLVRPTGAVSYVNDAASF